MKVVFATHEQYRIEEKSYYNHNYYRLPFSVNGFSILYEEWCDLNGFWYACLCDEDFKEVLYLNTEPDLETGEIYTFDSDKLSQKQER